MNVSKSFFHCIDRLEKKITGAFSVLVIDDFVLFPGTNFSGQRSMNFLLELIYIFSLSQQHHKRRNNS